MGEATYYGKIYFETNEQAQKALPIFKDFCKETYNAGEFWQENRGSFFADKSKVIITEEFWKQFREKFPNVSNYLEAIKLFGGDRNNALAGMLDIVGDIDDVDFIDVWEDAPYIAWSSTVWHFAQWDPILEWVTKSYLEGAKRFNWVSDEYADLFDQI